MKVLLAHPGTQHAFTLALELERRNLLSEFWTCFALPRNSLRAQILRFTPPSIKQRVANRTVELPPSKLRTVPSLEFIASLRLRLGQEPQVVMHWRNERFQRAIAQRDIEQSDAVIGFDTSSNILVERAAKADRPVILDQTIAHPRSKHRVYEQIKKQFPNWADDLEVRVQTVSVAEELEHRKATKIVVASSFAKRTMVENGVAESKIILNPYGVDLERFSIQHQLGDTRPFRFLFAGLVCARKGIPVLLEAWKQLNPTNAELWIVGPLSPTAERECQSNGKVRIVGKVSNAELAAIMSQSDVFVFPSYFEGFGLVLLEAMAAGLPVLTTTSTAAPDIVTQELDGFVTEPGDSAGLTDRLRFCLNNRDRITEMGRAARKTAERFSWHSFGDRWLNIVRHVLQPD